MSDIFEAIWSHPASHVSVSRRGPDGQFTNPDADIVLEEAASQGGECIDEDNAPRLLFHRVNDSLFTQPTFQAFAALLNNYTAVEGREEQPLSHPEHRAEVDAFVDAVLATEPMRLAFEHVRENLRPGMCDGEFRDLVRKVWFEPFTNNFSGTERFCVGFEHVFVGEDSSRANSPPRCGDSIGGYHSWIKCYLDEKSGRVNYLGHDYPSSITQQELADSHIATIIMAWLPSAEEGGHGHMLLKNPGGFFVGTRPECEIALGTVGLLSVLAGQFDNTAQAGTENHRRMKLGDAWYDLVLHPRLSRPDAMEAQVNLENISVPCIPSFAARRMFPMTATGTAQTCQRNPTITLPFVLRAPSLILRVWPTRESGWNWRM
jgi:poly(U)-specific endoribonuclease